MALTLKYREQTAQYFTETLETDFNLDMMQIPAGDFVMGTPPEEIERLCKEYEQESFREEAPQHLVSLSQFYMGKYPINQAQWKTVAKLDKVDINLEPEPSNFKENFQEQVDGGSTVVILAEQRPVEQVSWEEAKEFCARLSRETKRTYRLPTEAEWEYACRAVTSFQSAVTSDQLSEEEERGLIQEWNKQYYQPFHFGETISTVIANYDGSAKYGRGEEGLHRKQTTPVGYFKLANNFGLYDMHGNIWEWCEDDYHDSYEGSSRIGEAWINPDNSNTAKILRGGSWDDNPRSCRSTLRGFNDFGDRNYINGFRVVCSLPG